MSLRTRSGCALAVVLLIVAGCSHSPSRIVAPSISASGAAAKAMELYDTNHDGKISGAELDACPALKAGLEKIDTNGEGTITAEKLTARIKAWQESNIGRLGAGCTVLRNGKALADAEVKFVPEKILGSNMPPASGKTNNRGYAAISVPLTTPKDPPGAPPGYYRVEITKDGDNIPAKYNTATVLGEELAMDAKSSQKGITFNLAY